MLTSPPRKKSLVTKPHIKVYICKAAKDLQEMWSHGGGGWRMQFTSSLRSNLNTNLPLQPHLLSGRIPINFLAKILLVYLVSRIPSKPT
jgi:hypothetical protein